MTDKIRAKLIDELMFGYGRPEELKVMNDLKTRGVQDISIAVVDGLKGFPEAIDAVFPQTTVQTCILHPIRDSTACVS